MFTLGLAAVWGAWLTGEPELTGIAFFGAFGAAGVTERGGRPHSPGGLGSVRLGGLESSVSG